MATAPPRHPDTPTPRRRIRRRRPAFTLIELLLVLLLISILVGITVPSLKGSASNTTVDSLTGQLLALTQYARSQAIAEGVPYRLNVDVANRTYYLSKQDDYSPDFVDLGNEMGRTFEVPEGIDLQWDSSYLDQQNQLAEANGQVLPDQIAQALAFAEFRPSGRVDPAQIIVTDAEGNVTLVTCPSTTETFRIVKPDGTVKH